MKYRVIIPLLALVIGAGLGACSKDETIVDPVPTDSKVIGDRDTLEGNIKGTMKSDKTYYLKADAVVNAGDSLVIEPGARLIDLSNHALIIRGALTAVGTPEKMIYMGPTESRKQPGAWAGVECDSPSVVTMKYVRVLYGCGIRPDGRPRPSVYFLSNMANTSKFIMEDCEVSYTKDDGVQLTGGTGHIFRSVFRMNGVVEGSGVNFKAGFTGDVAYNYIWSANDHAIRAITSATVLFPQTNVNIYNNTIVNYGGKNPARPGAGVLIDQNTRANVYNNIFVNGRVGLRVTSAADAANTHYGNNLFYATVDSLRSWFYPSDGVGQPQPSDLIQVDPMFVQFDPQIDAASDANDPHLRPGSPAIGKGNPTYDPDLGAYTAKR